MENDRYDQPNPWERIVMEQPPQTPDSQQPETSPEPQQPQPEPVQQPQEPEPSQPTTPPESSQPTEQPQPAQQPEQPPQPQPAQPETAPPSSQPQPYQSPEPSQPPMQPEAKSTRRGRRNRFLAAAVVAVIACSIFAGVFGYWAGSQNSGDLSKLQKQITDLQNQIASLSTGGSGGTSEVVPENVSLSTLYNQVKDSVVVITDTQSGTQVEGSGFIDNLGSRMIVVTNNHVINSGSGISVTFSNGDGYAATVLGADAYADLAVLSVTDAPASEYHPLEIVSSATLSVGDFVAAVGSPFGLAGSMTTGIVSALGRTITETTAGNYPIADVIQFSAPINPGNSGGPLLNSAGQVVGINTAGIENSQNGGTAQGLGFAISSDTILREIGSLASSGSYAQYPYMGVSVTDNSYDIATQEGYSVTYGLLVEKVVTGGPADTAGLKAGINQVTIDGNQILVGGDIITAINGQRLVNQDQLSTYLAEKASPGQTITVTVLRNGQPMDLSLVLGTRPAPS